MLRSRRCLRATAYSGERFQNGRAILFGPGVRDSPGRDHINVTRCTYQSLFLDIEIKENQPVSKSAVSFELKGVSNSATEKATLS